MVSNPAAGEGDPVKQKPRTKKSAKVTKLVKQRVWKDQRPSEVEKAQIELHDGDDLYREIRIQNELEDESGEKVKLKEGADVEVTIEADPDQTVKKKPA